MKKSLKKVFAALAVMAVSCSALAFASCGETDKPNPDPKPDEPTNKISYQFLGNYDDLMSFGFVYDFCADLASDGVLTVYTYDMSGATSYTGTWKEAKDEDGITVLTIRDGVNPDGKYELYAENDGSYIWKDFYFTFSGGYSRKLDLKGSSTITYEVNDAWKTAVEARREKLDIPDINDGGNGSGGSSEDNKDEDQQPSEATEVGKYESGTSTLTLMSDGTAVLSAFGGAQTINATYTNENGVITFVDGDNTFTSVDGVLTISYSYWQGASLNFTIAAATEVASFKSGESSVLTFMSDGTCSLSAFGQTPSVFNYTYVDGVLSFSGNDSCPCAIDGATLDFTVFSAYHVVFENLDLSVLSK